MSCEIHLCNHPGNLSIYIWSYFYDYSCKAIFSPCMVSDCKTFLKLNMELLYWSYEPSSREDKRKKARLRTANCEGSVKLPFSLLVCKPRCRLAVRPHHPSFLKLHRLNVPTISCRFALCKTELSEQAGHWTCNIVRWWHDNMRICFLFTSNWWNYKSWDKKKNHLSLNFVGINFTLWHDIQFKEQKLMFQIPKRSSSIASCPIQHSHV
jgi:hypothetical protein